ncbi:unnamed protein product [Dracunculus medinensis]|uniref:Caenorhabditis elegans ly-6-related family-containing protein n=1 Tax=Dracunculus medinensis TaxID=318479 RepID=A0A0N4UR55_DRAME|nr:unnamed protein product [Dracunculus medinensis]
MSLPSLLYTLRCYSCANDFIVWHWRHFFLKRNYGLTTSDEGCVKPDYDSYNLQTCATTCFILYLNGTNRYDGKISILGVGRGCSSQFLTNDQHSQIILGSHSKISPIRNYLSVNFDMFDISEHWCFCINDACNTHKCFENYSNYLGSPLKRRQHFFDSYWLNKSTSESYLLFLIISLITFICF